METSFTSRSPIATRAISGSSVTTQAAHSLCSMTLFKHQRSSHGFLIDLSSPKFTITPVRHAGEERRSSFHHGSLGEHPGGETSRSADDVIKESLLSSDDDNEKNLPSLVLSIRQLAESVDKLAGSIISKNSEDGSMLGTGVAEAMWRGDVSEPGPSPSSSASTSQSDGSTGPQSAVSDAAAALSALRSAAFLAREAAMEAEQAASRAATAADEAVRAAELMEAIMGVDLSGGRGEGSSPVSMRGGMRGGVGEGGFSEAEAGEEHRLALALQRAFVQARVQGLGKPAGVALSDFVSACWHARHDLAMSFADVQLRLLLAEAALPPVFSMVTSLRGEEQAGEEGEGGEGEGEAGRSSVDGGMEGGGGGEGGGSDGARGVDKEALRAIREPFLNEELRVRTLWVRMVFTAFDVAESIRSHQQRSSGAGSASWTWTPAIASKAASALAAAAAAGEGPSDTSDQFVWQTAQSALEEDKPLPAQIEDQVGLEPPSSPAISIMRQSRLLVLLALDAALNAA